MLPLNICAPLLWAITDPSTPGSHIDWAGDEDDESLPDLNDWGVSTPQRPAGTPDPAEEQLISPLLVEGLKPLPELVSAKPVAGTPKTTSLPGLHIPAGTDVVNTVIDRSPTRSRDPSPIKPRSTRSRNASPNPSPVRDSKPVSPSFLPPKPAFLPERPTAAAQRAEMPARSSKANATPMRSPVSPVRARSRSPGHSPASSPKDTMHKLESHAKEEMNKLKEVDNHLAPPDDNVSGLSASIHAPSKEPSFPAEPLRSAPGNLQPLAAQQHDYHHTTIPNSNSYPNHTIPQKNPFTHNRAHTVGRPFQSHQFPSSHPTPRGARGAGFSTPPSSRRGEPAHARTQSSPPAPHGSYHRSPLNHRPVITGDAISRLARTIGGMGVNGQSTAQV
ncbi:hypothetical protein DL96DRAFT_923427 [Flagelloscypha sp. PMI_526]|nr:hypothetical protein DL96DRAFT_923427 [Flagelloscypha sp. PMI_526]